MSLATKRWVDGQIEEARFGGNKPRRWEPILGLAAVDICQYFFLGVNDITDADVTINPGYWERGKRGVVAVAETTVTITADQQWVWTRYDLAADTATIPTPSITYPVNDDNYVHWPLARFYFDGTKASLDPDNGGYVAHVGNIVCPGIYA